MGNDGATRENLFNTFFQKNIRAEGDPYLIMEDGFKIDSTTIYTAARVGSLLNIQLSPDIDIPEKINTFTVQPPPEAPVIGSPGGLGLTGETGAEGVAGADGIGEGQPAGPAGPTGPPGPAGADGSPGPRGEPGPTGFGGFNSVTPGPPGPTGATGPPGIGNGMRVAIRNTDPIDCIEKVCIPGFACLEPLYCDSPECGPDCD